MHVGAAVLHGADVQDAAAPRPTNMTGKAVVRLGCMGINVPYMVCGLCQDHRDSFTASNMECQQHA